MILFWNLIPFQQKSLGEEDAFTGFRCLFPDIIVLLTSFILWRWFGLYTEDSADLPAALNTNEEFPPVVQNVKKAELDAVYFSFMSFFLTGLLVFALGFAGTSVPATLTVPYFLAFLLSVFCWMARISDSGLFDS